jgi:hypothetical protein
MAACTLRCVLVQHATLSSTVDFTACYSSKATAVDSVLRHTCSACCALTLWHLQFQKDMQLMMDTPEFAAAMQASTKQMEAMMKDPKKRKEIEQQAKEAAKWIKA